MAIALLATACADQTTQPDWTGSGGQSQDAGVDSSGQGTGSGNDSAAPEASGWDAPTGIADSAAEAAGQDAATDDASQTDGAEASAPCVTQGKELCDGFESGMIDPKVWSTVESTGTSITVDNVHVHSGSHALHIQLVAGQSNTAQIADSVTFPANNNLFYTRAFFYFSPDLPADMMGGYHMAYLLATGNNTLGFVEAGLGSAGNKQYLGYSEYFGAGPKTPTDPTALTHGPTFTEFGPDSPTQVVPMKWICLELLQSGDATTTHRRVWVDGMELPEQVSDFSDRPPPMFATMSIGVLQYHTSPILTDVWVDDIRVSGTGPIGCNVP